MFTIAKFIAGLFGWDIQKVQRWIVIIGMVIIAAVLLGTIILVKSCWTAHKLKVSQAQIDTINKADEHDRKAELQKVVDDNAEIVRTVDNRTAISETNTIERNREIDARIAEADKKIQESKQQGHDVTGQELDCLLTGQNCQ